MPGRDFRPRRFKGRPSYARRRYYPRSGGIKWHKMVEKGLNLGRIYKDVSPYVGKVLTGLYDKINSELKYQDTTQTAQAVASTGNLYTLSLPAQGDGQGDRNGQKILLHDCLIRGTLAVNQSATSTNVRCLIGVDKMANGAQPAIGDILQSVSPFSPLDIDDSQGRFVILYDRLWTLSPDGKDSISFKIYKKLRFHQMFKGTGATTADIGKNYLFIVFISDEATNTPTVTYYNRVKYYDN